MEIKNSGRTPATVTDVLIKMLFLPSDEALPDTPDYHQEGKLDPSEAFLVTNATSFNRRTHRVDLSDLHLVKERSADLWLYGYVDYEDAFGRQYRGGYARLYKHDSPLTTNLHLGKNTRNYNYDKRQF